MKRYFTESEIKQAKADLKIREGIIAQLEAKLEIGKPRLVTVDGEHLVDLSLTVENHDGLFLIPKGTATVRLPSRKMESCRPQRKEE
ncbi:MAG: hypothetical protein AB1585_17025 [Thermodesulfobacteriota bacterium]